MTACSLPPFFWVGCTSGYGRRLDAQPSITLNFAQSCGEDKADAPS